MARRSPALFRLCPLRPRRDGEWSEQKAVTFIVTLAARGNVTLAARLAGMSRKSAYALRARQAGFAAAWDSAAAASRRSRIEGDKGHEVHDPRVGPSKGDSVTLRETDALRRDLTFADFATRQGLHRILSTQ